MANQGDSLSLQWVRGEIQETLKQSQQALAAFAENPEDHSQLRFCLNDLHQVHGTLRMVELEGAALVAVEMEALAEKLLNDPPEDMDRAIGSLMQGILQLPEYLSAPHGSDDDVPMPLLPLLNDLRAVRGAAFFSASALFGPDFSAARFDPPENVNQRLQASGVLDNVRKLHQMYQFALSGLERGNDFDAHLDYVDKVVLRLVKLCQKTPQGELWLAAGAFVDTLRSGHTGLGAAAMKMLSELDSELERLINESHTILGEPVPEDVLKNLLYFVAVGRDCNSERVRTLVQRYQLRRALPPETGHGEHGSASARAAMDSVAEVLTEELTHLKDRLDLFVRAGDLKNSDLGELLPGLRQIASTLSILGQESSQRVIEDQFTLLERLINANETVDDGILMDVAGALLYVETSISGLSAREGRDTEPSEEQHQLGHRITSQHAIEAGGAVLREARNALEQVKTGVVNFIASQWDQEEIKEVPELLFSIRGSLHLIPLERTATAIGSCERFIQDVLLGEAYAPGWDELDTLAEAITSIEYHIERLMDGVEDNTTILVMAEQRLENLGFPPGREPTRQKPEARETSTETQSRAPETATSGSKERDADIVDDDILEIFVNEADEVLATIREQYPRFSNNHEDHKALSDVRRAFHTLKGSGRLVEAGEIGELAWSVENALNQVIDGTIVMNDGIAAVLKDATDAIPTLVEDFRHQRSPSVDVSRLRARADALARGEALDTESGPASPEHSDTAKTATGDSEATPATNAAEKAEENRESTIDPVLRDIFRSETDSHLETLNQFLADAEGQDSLPHTDNLARALHTLKGSAYTAGIESIARVTAPMERFVKQARAAGHNADRRVLSLLERTRDFVQQGLERIDQEPRATLEGTNTFLADLNELASERFPEDNELLAQGPSMQKPDEGLVQVFLNDGIEQLLDADRSLEAWLSGNLGNDGLKALSQSLSGLARCADEAGVYHVSELAGALDHLYTEALDVTETPYVSMAELLREAHEALMNLMDQLAAGLATESPAALVTRLNEQAAELRQARSDAQQQTFQEQFGDNLESMDHSLREELDLYGAAEEPASEPEPEQDEAPAGAPEQQADVDPELAEIFLEEAHELINSTGEALHQYIADPADTNPARTLQRDLHTLKGGARMAEVGPVSDLSHDLEELFERIAEGRLSLGKDTGELLLQCHDTLARMVDQTSEFKTCEDASGLTSRVRALITGEAIESEARESEDAETESEGVAHTQAQTVDDNATGEAPDKELSTLFLDEAREIEHALKQIFEEWQNDPEQGEPINRMREELHALRSSARLSELTAIGELADNWESTLASVIEGAGDSTQALQYSRQAMRQLPSMLAMVEAGRTPSLPESAETESTRNQDADDPEKVDPEVLEIFLEEAGELVDTLDNTLAAWQKAEGEEAEQHSNEAQRALHTIKGGARLAELTQLGERAHHFESLLSRIEQGRQSPSEAEWEEIHKLHDEIISRLEQLRNTHRASIAAQAGKTTTEPESPQPESRDDTASAGQAENEASTPAESEPASSRPETGTGTQNKQQGRDQRKAELARSAQETIRINAQLMDDLVNLAGETSITRGRMEQQISDFSHTLDEMQGTTERLREQLRRMEIETEAQIRYSAEQEYGPHHEQDFDPLEMDRYSSVQQLSRALSESASDLADLRETMADKVRDAETLLLQQQRTNTELQEGLMRTRMVPFSSMVPRLRRIVRQITSETGKKAHFEISNAEDELDRTVLDRMVAPLEHMLRNAIDHGIESEDERRKAGKPRNGNISLNLSREGGEVVLRLQDDGGGIDTEKVRQRAVRQNMLDSGDDLSEHEILQFILQPGFSTAASVTQISGRGVGLDVVASEIKQLGGSLAIDSNLGQGTSFTVRLPFTVSVNRALMVSIAEDYYAIPLNTIEGIVRVSTYELQEYYQPDAPLYEYAGQRYRLQYLGALLNSEHQPKLQGQALPLPVMLVRGAEHPMALQVDSLMGSREIVVKSLGPQFAGVRGVSGATILGDGNVVIILDLPAMIRSDILAQRQRMLTEVETREASREHRPTQIMVVDDSITVRKVTSRLLERHGLEVLLAKDGIDAVGQLQHRRPDVVLLDIEMPRLDGFEVASFIRHDSKLKNVPIVMITSRTGEKHRERAETIGVNHYLGKPFQEKELLDTIMEQTGVVETS